MRLKRNILFLLFCCCAAAGCEKVINVDIKNTSKQYVIEGIITDNDNSCRVNLSQTIDFNDSNTFNGVPDAIVTVSEDGRNPVRLSAVENGIYRANFSGRPGHTYTLNVQVDGKTYTATSTMPVKINMDTLYVTERVFLGKTRKFATLEFTDPAGLGNAYRFVQYVDGYKENTIFITNDNLLDGRHVIYDLLVFGNEEYTLLPEDQLRVEMVCISPYMYKYWYSLTQSALGQNQSASPANPLNQFGEGAIGYFTAQTFQAKSIVVR